MWHNDSIIHRVGKKVIRLNKTLFVLLFISLMLLLSTCKKEQSVGRFADDSFLHTYSSDKDNTCFYIGSTSDKGYLILSSTGLDASVDGRAISILKVNALGNIEWEKTLSDSFQEPHITLLNDGSFLINSYYYWSKIVKMDRDGNVIFKGWYTPSKVNALFSTVIAGEDSGYFVGASAGGWSGSSTISLIQHYNNNGDYMGNREIHDSIFKGKIYEFHVYRQQNPEIYYMFGSIYPDPFAWEHNARVFVSKMEFSGTKIVSRKTVILDPKNGSDLNYYTHRHLLTRDNQLVLCANQAVGSQLTDHIYKVDEDLKTVWDLSFKIEGYIATVKSLSETDDGDYLLCGSCKTSIKNLDQPFVCKISRDGKVLWVNIMPTALTGSFNWVSTLPNGSLIFGGTTNGYGQGILLRDVFMMKTDAMGNLK